MQALWLVLLAIGAAQAALPCATGGIAPLDACVADCTEQDRINPARTYNCSDAQTQDNALFVWTNGTFESSTKPFTLTLGYLNATGSFTVHAGDITSPFALNVAVVARQATLTLDYDPIGSKLVNYTYEAIYCTPANFTHTGLQLTWNEPAGVAPGVLVYTVYDTTAGTFAKGTMGTGNTFNVDVQCDKNPHSFEIRSNLLSPALTCLLPATGVQFAVNEPISAITNLQIVSASATTSAQSASMTFNASWNVPAQTSGCTGAGIKYVGQLQGGVGVDKTVQNLPIQVVDGVVTFSSAWFELNPNFGNGQFTFSVHASTDAGDSPVASVTFTVDPCASSCSAATPCSFSCVCETPANVTVDIKRSYVCMEPTLQAGFFGAEILNLTHGLMNITYAHSDHEGFHPTSETNVNAPKVFPVTNGLINGSLVLFDYKSQYTNAASALWIRAATFGCVVTLTQTGPLTFTWEAPKYSNGLLYTVYQNGKAVTTAGEFFTYTANADCNVSGVANFTVHTTSTWAANLSCAEHSKPVQLQLSPTPPEAPANVVVTGVTGKMNETVSQLFFKVQWDAPKTVPCPQNYTATVTVVGTNLSWVVPLNTVTVNDTVHVLGGVTLNDFAFGTDEMIRVVITANSAGGSASSLPTVFPAPGACDATCPSTFDPVTNGCHAVCSCRSNAATAFTLSRSYTCGAIFGEAGFFWTKATLESGEVQLHASYIANATNHTAFDGKSNASVTVAPLAASALTGTAASFHFATVNTGNAHSFAFESHAIGCVPTLTTVGELELSWNGPTHADGYLTYTVFQNGAAVANVTGHQYMAQGQCNGLGNFSVVSTLLNTNLACPVHSNTLTNVPLSFPPKPISNLRVLGSSSNATDRTISVNPTWTAPSSLGFCDLEHYVVRITSDHGLDSTVKLNATQVVNTNGTITVPAGVVLTNVTVEVNAIYTITVSVVTAKGESPAVWIKFYLPGFLCMESCPLDQSCDISCQCAFPKENISSFMNRTFTCDLGVQVGFFFTSTVDNFVNQVGSVDISYTDAAAHKVNITAGSLVHAFSVSDNITSSLAQLSVRPTDPLAENSTTFMFKAATIPCVPVVTAVPDLLQLKWTIAEKALPHLTYRVLDDGLPANGTYGEDKMSFTATPKCNKIGKFTVLSTLQGTGLDCKAASHAVSMHLSHRPSPVSDLAVSGQTLVINGTESILSFNASWTAPLNLFGCDVVHYHLQVSDANNVTYYNGTAGAAVHNYTAAVSKTLILLNTTLDANAVYYVTVYATTAAGNSDPMTQQFTFPSSSSSSSGLSNTVIAGIAVGATIGVVAIALVVYKCMSSRKDYEPLSGSSNV